MFGPPSPAAAIDSREFDMKPEMKVRSGQSNYFIYLGRDQDSSGWR